MRFLDKPASDKPGVTGIQQWKPEHRGHMTHKFWFWGSIYPSFFKGSGIRFLSLNIVTAILDNTCTC